MIKKFKDFKKINEDITHSDNNVPKVGAKVESINVNEHKDMLFIKIEDCDRIVLVGDFKSVDKINESDNYYDGWIGVDSYKDIPDGNWIVYLEEELYGNKIHSIHVSKYLATIGNNLTSRYPKVIDYQILPSEPVKARTFIN